jgi:hypothetical protein
MNAQTKAWDGVAKQDDALVQEVLGESQSVMLVGDRAAGHMHELPEQWLRSRVRGWMELCESPGLAYWVGTYTADGTWIYCSSDRDLYLPKTYRQVYAQNVCKFLNQQCNFGGAWLAGWFRGGKEFYLLWKDADGDLQIPIESDKPFIVLQRWGLADWEKHACTAYSVWAERQKLLEIRSKDTVKVAQGERPSNNHLANAPV